MTCCNEEERREKEEVKEQKEGVRSFAAIPEANKFAQQRETDREFTIM